MPEVYREFFMLYKSGGYLFFVSKETDTLCRNDTGKG